MADETSPQTYKKKRQRSPGYPGISLESAIERAQVILDKEGRHWIPVDVVLRVWGYNPASGIGLVSLSALLKFGLLEDEGTSSARQVRLTDLARRIILDLPESPERMEAVRTAALNPDIHQALWRKYEGRLPPSDEGLKVFLRRDLNFTDRAVAEFIPQFRKTVDFAQLDESVSLESDDYKDLGRPMTATAATAPTSREPAPTSGNRRTTTVQVPLAGGDWVFVQAAFPLSPGDWEQFLRVLEVMKPGLVADNKASGPSEDE
jgi:hypothetical protein